MFSFDDMIDDILREWVWRIPNPEKPDFKDPEHIYHLREAMLELDIPEEVVDEWINNVCTDELKEQDEDEDEDSSDSEPDKESEPPEDDKEQEDDSEQEEPEDDKDSADQEDDKDSADDEEMEPEKTPDELDAERMAADVPEDQIITVGGKTYRLDMLSDLEIEQLKKKKKEVGE